MNPIIDQTLLNACLARDRAGQRQLYDRCLPYLGLIARRYLREEAEIKDVLQDSFVAIFRHLEQFDAGKASFKTWATRIVINNCLKRNAKNERTATVALDTEYHAPAIAPEVLATFDNKELNDWLKRMPEEFYAVFNLHVVEGYAHAEIAELLGIGAALSRQRLSRARKWLAKTCRTDRDFPLRAEYTYRQRLQLLPLLFTIWAFVEQTS